MVRLPRYLSDLTDSQWALREPLLLPPSQDGRRPQHHHRDLVDAICSVDRTGWAWWALPVDFPLWQTVYGCVVRWQATGVTKGAP